MKKRNRFFYKNHKMMINLLIYLKIKMKNLKRNKELLRKLYIKIKKIMIK